MKTQSLLEVLRYQIGCMYISDLHQPAMLRYVQNAVAKLSADDYSLQEWEDTVYYITGQQKHFANQEQAAAYLLDCKIENRQ